MSKQTNSLKASRKALRNEAKSLREKADALEREADAIIISVPKPRKTKAQLEKELEAERVQRRKLESSNRSLRRQLDPPDYSYFGLGDGPT